MSHAYKTVILYIFVVKNIVGQAHSTVLSPVVTEECRKRGICMTVQNYPTELAKRLIRELKDKDTIFPSDGEQDIILDADIPQVRSRLGPIFFDYEEKTTLPLCNSIKWIESPKLAENRNNTWNYILNDEDDPIQRFSAERCASEGFSCSEHMMFKPNYASVCVQRWSLKEMFYIDDNENVAKDYFKVPTCCSCKLYHINK